MPSTHEHLFYIRPCWMELCNKSQNQFGFFLFFREGLFSSFLFYFGEDIFYKVNWVASLGQTFFKVVHFLLKWCFRRVCAENLFIHKPKGKSKRKRTQYYTSILKEALSKMRKNGKSDESFKKRFTTERSRQYDVLLIKNLIISLRSFPSIALRIPTAHNFTRN